MGRVLARPLVLLPLGVVLVLVGVLTALNGVGAWRWGVVVDDGRACGPGEREMCLVREDVGLDGPHRSWREGGDDWELRLASGRTQEVSLPDRDSAGLVDGGVTEAVMLSQPDGDVVGVEADGRTLGTTGVGAYGVLQLGGLGLLTTSLGAGLVLVARRMRRSTLSWLGHEPVQRHGSVVIALPVVLGFVLWLLPRFLW